MVSIDAAARSRRIGLACLVLTAVGWGVNWPVIKLILRDWPPLFARGTAGLAAALGLAAVALARGEQLAVPPTRSAGSRWPPPSTSSPGWACRRWRWCGS